MAANKSLYYYKWAPGDFLRISRAWPPIARLAYRELLDAQWDLGALPDDPGQLRELVPGITDRDWKIAWRSIEVHFPAAAGGRQNPGLEVQRAEITKGRKRQQTGAAITNHKRWGTPLEAFDEEDDP